MVPATVTLASLAAAGLFTLPTSNPLGTALGSGWRRTPRHRAALGGLGVTTLLSTRLAPARFGQPLGGKKGGFALSESKIRTAVRANDHFI